MKREYIVLFKETNGHTYEFTFKTDNIQKTIYEYRRNRSIVSHRIIEEGTDNKKQMLFG